MATAERLPARPLIRRIDGEYGIWRAGEQPLTVEYRAGVLEEIRAAVGEAFRAVPRGGLEIGGVLLGRREGYLVQITGYRPLECEHAFGPAFSLSERDHAALAALQRAIRGEGLVPVGWYHSHTRSEISLTGPDLEIHARYFPEPWQVALVLKPQKLGPARAAFFCRRPDGALDAGGEFLLEPYRKPRAVAQAAPPTVPKPAVPPPPVAQAVPPAAPSGTAWRWLALALAAVFVALGFAGRIYAPPQPRPAPPATRLRAADNNGQLRISWDHAAERAADRAVLEIRDGVQTTSLPLDAEHVRLGAVIYARQSERVDLRLRVFTHDGATREEYASFIGQPVVAAPTAPPPPAPPKPDLQALRQRDLTIEKLRRRNEELETALRALRHRLEVETAFRSRR